LFASYNTLFGTQEVSGTMVTLSGELMGLPRLGVVDLTGVAVRDGSTLAMGVISVPMSRVDTAPRLFIPGDEVTAATVEESATGGMGFIRRSESNFNLFGES
jgi:hypothetical protein